MPTSLEISVDVARLRSNSIDFTGRIEPVVEVNNSPNGWFTGNPTGKIEGYVYNVVDGVSTPVKRRLFLIRDFDALRMRMGTSDPVTGYYKFENLERVHTYSVIVHDLGQTLNATIKDKITPDPMT